MSAISTPLPTPPDNFSTQIASATVSSSAITFNVDDASGLPTEGVGVLFKKDSDGEVVAGSIEFIHWTGVSGNTINLSDTGDRGLTGSDSGAQAYVADDYFEVWVSSYYYDSQYDAFTAEHNTDGTHGAVTATSVALGGDTALAGNASQAEVATGTSDALVVTPTGASIYGNSSMARQAIINGNFDVWQRNTTFTDSTGSNNDDVYTADRWNLISDGNDIVDVRRDTDSPDKSLYSMSLEVETANKKFGIVQFIENNDAIKLDNQTVSVSFQAKATGLENVRCAVLSWDSTADSITSDVVSAWNAEGSNPTWATNWTAENTATNIAITSSWATYSVTGISIDTASMANLAVVIWLDDTDAAVDDVLYLSQVQLCVGSVALPFQPKSYAQELADCQRYCIAYTSSVATAFPIGVGYAYNTTLGFINVHLPTEMRTPPSLTATASDWDLAYKAASAALSTLAIGGGGNSRTTNTVRLSATVGSAVLTAGECVNLVSDGTADRLMYFDAEL